MEWKAIRSKKESEHVALVSANNEFAFKCYKTLKSDDKNLFFSPFSISLCLAMAYTGARGTTAEQMASTLHFKGIPDLNASFKGITEKLNAPSRSQNYELWVANALWMQEDYEVYPDYIEMIQDSYSGGVFGVDFKNNPEGERITINNWVEEKTKNKIKELLKPNMVTTLTRVILTNAIYFFSNWQHKFVPHATRQEPFTLINGQKVNIPLMYQQKFFAYAENAEFQAIELPYRGGELSMVILLPKKVDGILEMENSLTAAKLMGWLETAPFEEVKVYIPKFKITSEFDLVGILKTMGMVDACVLERADFTGISPRNPNPMLNLFIGAVIHKAFVDVNEQGTEAAAATAMAMMVGAAPGVPRPVHVFKADHPFLLLIRDDRTGSILFLGRIMDPRSEY